MDAPDRLPVLLEQALRAGAIDAEQARRALAALAPVREPAARLQLVRGLGLPAHVVNVLLAHGAGAAPGSSAGTPPPSGAHGPGSSSGAQRPGSSSGAFTAAPAPAPTNAAPAARGTAKFPSHMSTQADPAITNTTPAAGGSKTPGGLLEGSMRFSASRLVGSRIGPFTVEKELGRGGMGVVLKAMHDDGRVVALKLMTDLGGSADAAKRFAREASALQALDHDHVVKFAGASAGEAGVAGGMPWLAMQFVEGGDLKKLLEDETLEQDEVARIVAEIASGVSHAHRHGIIHRDLKPGNVLVRLEDRRAVVTDFGLAKSLEASRFTKTGSMVGTLTYMAPEQVVGKSVGPPCDVWAIGAILYRALTGADPFVEASPMALAAKICDGSFPAPRSLRPDIADDLEATLLSCLQLDPAKRPSAALLAASLRGRRPIGGVRRRRSLPAIAAAALVAVVGLGFAIRAATRSDPPATTRTTNLDDPSTDTGATRTPAPPPPPPDPLAGPWPALEGAGWSLAWSLGGEPAPAVRSPALWEGSDGRVAAPALAAREGRPGALEAAFEGQARSLSGGRVAVRYVDLARVLRPHVEEPGNYVSMADPPAGQVELDASREGAVSLLAANDCEGTTLQVGAARWTQAAVACQLRLVAPVDSDAIRLTLGRVPGATAVTFAYGGRGGTAAAAGQSVAARLDSQWTELRFAPGAERGRRLVFGAAQTALVDEALVDPAPPGPVLFNAVEAHLGIADVVIEGRPETTDVPATCAAPVELPPTAAIAVVVTWDPAPCGGPRISIGAREGPAWSLEVDGPRVVLLRGGEPRGAIALPDAPRPGPREAWLRLERHGGDRIVARIDAGGGPLAIERLDPLPVSGGPCVAAWGSTGPRATFARVDLAASTRDDDRARADLDRSASAAQARERLEAEATTSPAAQWRLGALLLARCAEVPRLDPALRAPSGLEARRAQATAASRALESAADRLAVDDPRRADALARAVLARVIAADPDGAERVARRLSDAVGATRAREAIDPLEHAWDGTPSLGARLVRAYTNIRLVAVRDAALRAALVLAPDQEGEVCLGLATNMRHHEPKPDPRTPEGRKVIEGALALFHRARAAGVAPAKIDAYEADTTMDLQRWDEALALWDRVVVQQPAYWWGWLRRGQTQNELARPQDALESLLGALARAPTRPQVHREVMETAQRVQSRPGLVAAALAALADCLGAQGQSLRPQADQLARQVPVDQDDRDADLAVYVLARGGARPGARAAGERPTAVLARARAGDAQARARLRELSAEDALVRHLALCDRELDSLVR